MGGIIDKITDFIKEMLQGWVLSNLDTMFSDVNDKVGTIAGEVSKTPSTWNSGIFSMIRTLSENVVVPIAGMIISFVLIYELITMVIDKIAPLCASCCNNRSQSGQANRFASSNFISFSPCQNSGAA